jgi:Flp pilus assembly protein TadG
MRRITDRPGDGTQRRHGIRDERGAVLAFVAVTMVILIGAVSLSIDVGRIYSERRELQNGADASSLAVAYDCASGDCGSSAHQYDLAEEYADANARDGLAKADDVTVNLGEQTVRVQTATEDATRDTDTFDMMLARVIGIADFPVTAEATVAWGSPRGGSTLPIIFSRCEWQHFTEDLSFLHQSSDIPLMPPASGYAREADYTTILFHGDSDPYDPPCHVSPSGQDLPGGFGWLDAPIDCEAVIDDEDWVEIDPGASSSTGCDRSEIRDLVGTVQLIPYFDDVTGTGSGAEYHVAGFGAFYITGLKFPGITENSIIPGLLGAPPCTGSINCIQGYLIEDWVVSGGGEIGGNDFGVVIIKFVK